MSARQKFFVHPHCLERLNELGWREGMTDMAVIEHIRVAVTSAIGNTALTRKIDDMGKPTLLVTLTQVFPETMYAIVRSNWSTKPGCSPQVVVTLLTSEMVRNNEDFRWNGNRGHIDKSTKPLTSKPFTSVLLAGPPGAAPLAISVPSAPSELRAGLNVMLDLAYNDNVVNGVEGSIVDIVGDFVKLAMDHLADQI